MTVSPPAKRPAKQRSLPGDRTAEILAKLAVISADILDLDDRLTRLDHKHRNHTSEAVQ